MKGPTMEEKEYDVAEFLDNVPLGTPEQERQLARNWINTAAFHARNEEYHRNKRYELLQEIGELYNKFVDDINMLDEKNRND